MRFSDDPDKEKHSEDDPSSSTAPIRQQPTSVGSAKAASQDELDLQRAHTKPRQRSTRFSILRKFGPGLITGSADDDPSGIGTYSVAGAQFGYLLLWLTPVCTPLMIAVQEMCARISVITGKGLAGVLKQHYSRSTLWIAVALLCVANTINVWADLNVMAASTQMLFGRSFVFWLSAITIATVVLLVLVPYREYVFYLKWLCLSLLAYVVTALLPSVHNDWGQIVHHFFIPHWNNDPAFVMTAVGFLGTSITPYCFFWQASETVEDEVAEGTANEIGGRITPVSEEELKAIRADTSIGMIYSQAVTFFIVICTAATLHTRGITNIQTAQDAAKALLPLGKSAYTLFTVGIIGTGLLGIPTMAASAAYAICEITGWRYGLYRRFSRARHFYLTIAGVILVGFLLNFVGSISPVKGLLYAAIINGVVAPPLIVLILRICNNEKIVHGRRNGKVSNLFGWLTVILMSLAVAIMFWAMLTGKM